MRAAAAALLLLLGPASAPALAHGAAHREPAAAQSRLPTMGPARDFALQDQDGATVTLRGLRGKVVVVSFLYTACPDICPMLTERLVEVQEAVRAQLGGRAGVVFLGITVDPERDTPEALRAYAEVHGAAAGEGWHFLTGPRPAVEAIARGYGVVVRRAGEGGEIEHTTLTSLVDPRGMLRVQYLGTRFATEEFASDIAGLAPRRR